MNTYFKFCPNVFAAKCEQQHAKGDVITLTTKHGAEHECTVWNYLGRHRDGSYCYSVTRTDGFNFQEWAKRRAERQANAAQRDEKIADQWYEKAQEGKDFLVLGEPIKIGHHSEKRHRALIERNHNRFGKFVEASKEAEKHKDKAAYWEEKAKQINLSMPESLEYYEFKLEEAEAYHAKIKSGEIPKDHAYTLTYSKKAVNELKKKLELAQKLWA